MKAIETHGLTKDYGKLKAVNGLDLKVNEGSIYGFLGPNGAGKSTTINMLMGFIRPTEGTATIMGYDISSRHNEISNITGYLPERPAFYENMTGFKNMSYFGKLLKVPDLQPRIAELIKTVGLEGRENDRVRTYSHGMRQRLGIAISLLGNPKLLILDEPTTGLDPQGSHDIRKIIKELKNDKVTIFLSSHILHEVQEICDEVGIIKNGRLIVEKPMDNFLRSTGGNLHMIEIIAPNMDASYSGIAGNISGVQKVTVDDGRMSVMMERPEIAEEINIALIGAGCRVRSITEVKPTLEDAFLKVVSEEHAEV
ncbi:ABC transporter ATP-binding protein [Methanocella sp. CWC-04]|uniref:ABC transporter ATP-binding protein n=1 Tax=Methanooceanicella nereidis TaxID=2052831 RepID=A0AAP2RAM4_9EURY|nr:ABC transporter ATP-binding protein [Methanocella sp. CWC-04]MCD1293989.1 ABC transporter ATP-binding protein [Methanocella sp. CWC-04]